MYIKLDSIHMGHDVMVDHEMITLRQRLLTRSRTHSWKQGSMPIVQTLQSLA